MHFNAIYLLTSQPECTLFSAYYSDGVVSIKALNIINNVLKHNKSKKNYQKRKEIRRSEK